MNFYTPHGHSAYATAQQGSSNNNNDSISQQQQVALQAALHAFDQPPAPSLREVLGAYRLKGDGDREMLLAILGAKAAEDQRIAAMAQLHHTILQVTHSSITQNVLANQLPPLGGSGLGVGLGHHHSDHSHTNSSPRSTTTHSMDSNSPPTRSQLMSISSLIGERGGNESRTRRSPSGSMSPASGVGDLGDRKSVV